MPTPRTLLPLFLASLLAGHLGAQTRPRKEVELKDLQGKDTDGMDAKGLESSKVGTPEDWQETVVRVFLDVIKQDLQRYALDKVKARLQERLRREGDTFTQSLKALEDLDSWQLVDDPDPLIQALRADVRRSLERKVFDLVYPRPEQPKDGETLGQSPQAQKMLAQEIQTREHRKTAWLELMATLEPFWGKRLLGPQDEQDLRRMLVVDAWRLLRGGRPISMEKGSPWTILVATLAYQKDVHNAAEGYRQLHELRILPEGTKKFGALDFEVREAITLWHGRLAALRKLIEQRREEASKVPMATFRRQMAGLMADHLHAVLLILGKDHAPLAEALRDFLKGLGSRNEGQMIRGVVGLTCAKSDSTLTRTLTRLVQAFYMSDADPVTDQVKARETAIRSLLEEAGAIPTSPKSMVWSLGGALNFHPWAEAQGARIPSGAKLSSSFNGWNLGLGVGWHFPRCMVLGTLYEIRIQDQVTSATNAQGLQENGRARGQGVFKLTVAKPWAIGKTLAYVGLTGGWLQSYDFGTNNRDNKRGWMYGVSLGLYRGIPMN